MVQDVLRRGGLLLFRQQGGVFAAVHVAQEAEAGAVGGEALAEHAVIVKVDIDAGDDFFAKAVQQRDQAQQHLIAFIAVGVAAVVCHGDALDQLVVRQKVAVAVIDVPAGGG